MNSNNHALLGKTEYILQNLYIQSGFNKVVKGSFVSFGGTRVFYSVNTWR